ncbi:MAG: fimbrial biogenesis chaperone [Pseudomonadales bacterium]
MYQTLRRVTFRLTTCLLLLAAASTQANMVLSNAIVHFEPGAPSRQDVEITNTGAEPLYVQIEPKAVLDPGTEQESREVIVDPREFGLLVTPNRLVIAPGASRAIRLVNIGGHDEHERIFRITARPVAGELQAKSSGLKILIGYEVLAIVYPAKAEPQLDVERKGRQLLVRNVGNTNVLLQEGFQCEDPKLPDEACTSMSGRRMYPGNEWQSELPHDLPVRFYQSVGTRNSVETYP